MWDQFPTLGGQAPNEKYWKPVPPYFCHVEKIFSRRFVVQHVTAKFFVISQEGVGSIPFGRHMSID